ncbi:MAG: hypothetical protein AAFR66_12540 [Bacteroidota bacterium]
MNLRFSNANISLRSTLSREKALDKLHATFDDGSHSHPEKPQSFNGYMAGDGIVFHKINKSSVKVNGRILYPVFNGKVVSNGMGSLIQLSYEPNRNVLWFFLSPLPVFALFMGITLFSNYGLDELGLMDIFESLYRVMYLHFFLGSILFFGLVGTVQYFLKVRDSIAFMKEFLSAEEIEL